MRIGASPFARVAVTAPNCLSIEKGDFSPPAAPMYRSWLTTMAVCGPDRCLVDNADYESLDQQRVLTRLVCAQLNHRMGENRVPIGIGNVPLSIPHESVSV
jgi:hypothetical protein